MSDSVELQLGATTLTLHKLTDAMRDSYAAWMKGTAIRQLALCKQEYSPTDYAAERHALQTDIATGAYAFGGELYQRFVVSEHGYLQLVRMLSGSELSDTELAAILDGHIEEFNDAFCALHGLPTPAPSDAPAPKP